MKCQIIVPLVSWNTCTINFVQARHDLVDSRSWLSCFVRTTKKNIRTNGTENIRMYTCLIPTTEAPWTVVEVTIWTSQPTRLTGSLMVPHGRLISYQCYSPERNIVVFPRLFLENNVPLPNVFKDADIQADTSVCANSSPFSIVVTNFFLTHVGLILLKFITFQGPVSSELD